MARLVTIGRITTALAWSVVASAFGDDLKPPTEPPIPIFLNAPSDREAFWKMLGRPDLVILDGELYRKLRAAADPAVIAPLAPVGWVIESLGVSGEVSGDWARLTLDYQVVLEADGPFWVSVHLDGLTLSEVREGSKELPARMVDGRAWQVELQGKGTHSVRVRLFAPVRSTVEGRRLDLAIPPVASTRLDLIAPPTTQDGTVGLNERVATTTIEGSESVRLATRLSPRSKIELAWRERTDLAVKLPALLSSRGGMAIEIERGSIRTRSSWLVSALRGTTNQLTVRLDPAEEVLDVEVEGKPVSVVPKREGGRTVLVIPLSEPIRVGVTRGVTLVTNRPIASSGTVRVLLQGYSFDQAKVQTGVVAVARVGPLFLNPNPGRGLRRIDPRTELPDSLRNRAETVLAFEVTDQPFELNLSIEPAPPRLQVETRTTINLDARLARVQTRLDCRTSQGRMFEVPILLPKGLDLESAEPLDVVESIQVVPIDPKSPADLGVETPRRLTITLTSQAREAEAFSIVLKGRALIDPSGPVALPLFQPVVNTAIGGRFAVVTDRNVSVDLASTRDDSTSFRVDWGLPPADWVWPTRRPGPEQGLLWLRSDANPETLPLKAVVRNRSIRHESTLTASVDRRGAEVVDEISGEVAFGTLPRLDLAIPREVGDRWEVEGSERVIREPLDVDLDGTRRYRLRFARDFVDTFKVRIRYRLPFAEVPTSDREGRLKLATVRVLEGSSTSHRVVISSEPGIEIKAEAKGWSATNSVETTGPLEASSPVKVALTRTEESAGPVGVAVKFGPQLPVPGLVVSRLLIKTVQRPDNDLATTASFWVETREAPMIVGLNAGSVWVRARVGSVELGEGGVEVIGPDQYRIRFPASTPTGPVLVTVDSTTPASAIASGWPAPQLRGGGVILQTLWHIQILGTRAGVGSPSGWLDENQWYWDGLIWRRRPWKTEAALTAWLTGENPQPQEPGSKISPLASIPADQASQPVYLFSRVGGPIPLQFRIISRLTLVLLCSGPALLVGLLVLSRRPPPRWVAGSLLILIFVAGSIVDLNVLFLVVQSSVLGVALFGVALAMQWAIERRNPSRPAVDRVQVVGTSAIGSAMSRSEVEGSDESTAIRARPPAQSGVSTADHIFLTRPTVQSLEERSDTDRDRQ